MGCKIRKPIKPKSNTHLGRCVCALWEVVGQEKCSINSLHLSISYSAVNVQRASTDPDDAWLDQSWLLHLYYRTQRSNLTFLNALLHLDGNKKKTTPKPQNLEDIYFCSFNGCIYSDVPQITDRFLSNTQDKHQNGWFAFIFITRFDYILVTFHS